jgi:hypothetical protein
VGQALSGVALALIAAHPNALIALASIRLVEVHDEWQRHFYEHVARASHQRRSMQDARAAGVSENIIAHSMEGGNYLMQFYSLSLAHPHTA